VERGRRRGTGRGSSGLKGGGEGKVEGDRERKEWRGGEEGVRG
jgi:hypothetical protein